MTLERSHSGRYRVDHFSWRTWYLRAERKMTGTAVEYFKAGKQNANGVRIPG